MKTALILLIALFVTAPCSAADKWTPADIGLEAVSVALTVADWGQTLDISNHPGRFKETNLMLGKHPRRGEINAYFPAVMLIHGVVSHYLPKPYRNIWQAVTVGVELAATSINYQAGVRIGF